MKIQGWLCDRTTIHHQRGLCCVMQPVCSRRTLSSCPLQLCCTTGQQPCPFQGYHAFPSSYPRRRASGHANATHLKSGQKPRGGSSLLWSSLPLLYPSPGSSSSSLPPFWGHVQSCPTSPHDTTIHLNDDFLWASLAPLQASHSHIQPLGREDFTNKPDGYVFLDSFPHRVLQR